MGNAQSTDNPSAVAIDNPTDFPITKTSTITTTSTGVASSIKTTSTTSTTSTGGTPKKKPTTGYYSMPQRTIVKASNTPKKPQPFTGSFFNTQYAEPIPHAHVKKPNRSAGHVNFFEVAAATNQPAKSVKSGSSSSNSSLNKKSYPSTYNSSQHKLKKLHSNASSGNNSQTSSTASTTVANNDPHDKKPPLPKEDADYIYLNGRRYWKGHGSQVFILPCDDDENDRLMTIHYILKSVFNGNFISPIGGLFESPKQTKVLDVGCGAGTWILEMSTEYPNTEFYGIDDCPLFPTHIKPPNAHFTLNNVLKGLPYPDNTFDFVYMRSMILYFTPKELSELLTEISRVMKPGGFFEVVDTSYTIRNAGPLSNKIVNTDIKNWLQHSSKTSASTYESNTNHPIFTFLMLAPQQPASSFVGNFIDICQEHATLPLGGWGGGQIGDLHGANFKSLLSSLNMKKPSAVTPQTLQKLDEKLDALNLNSNANNEPLLPLPKNTVNTILEECDRYKSYLDWFACYARKPLDDDQLEQSTLDSIYEFVDGFVDV